ncbi:MAG: YHYH protein [Bacteroidetes bacterium]|nr:YHYH protein [Bacteroidota bacterium]MDA1334349.1 YHYH protein [Bacteroidota bacterium]
MRSFHFVIAFLLFVPALTSACGNESEDSITGAEQSGDIPAAYAAFDDGVNLYMDGDFVVIESTGVPNHSSPYFDTSNSKYQAYDGDNNAFQLNPNRIATQILTFRIPSEPKEASTKAATPLGAIGVSLNGVPFYNQYAGPNQPLTFEINSFDQYLGHPQQFGAYHYHMEPVYITDLVGKEGLIGFLLDGFPVYGPQESGRNVTNADLDVYHGHDHATSEYPGGIYHYHITAEDPYLNGNGYFGSAGTVSQ